MSNSKSVARIKIYKHLQAQRIRILNDTQDGFSHGAFYLKIVSLYESCERQMLPTVRTKHNKTTTVAIVPIIKFTSLFMMVFLIL